MAELQGASEEVRAANQRAAACEARVEQMTAQIGLASVEMCGNSISIEASNPVSFFPLSSTLRHDMSHLLCKSVGSNSSQISKKVGGCIADRAQSEHESTAND